MDAFPRQPINIFIPRGKSSGAIRLSTQIADAIATLTDATGANLGLRANVLTKFGGNSMVALDYFEALPPNGYNVIQLNDTYAGIVAKSGQAEAPLVPISFSQIAFSQIYVRTDDPRYSDLDSFLAYAADTPDAPLRIARFGADPTLTGLERILIDRFTDLHAQRERVADRSEPTGPLLPLPLTQIGYDSAAPRYYSMFDETLDATQKTDALLEQPGDVAGLIDSDLVKPIFTLLPQDLISPRFSERLGETTGFSGDAKDGCRMQYRFRGFFVSRDVPVARRKTLEWIFAAAFDTEMFQQINRANYVDLLYPDDTIRQAYCSADAARAFFDERIETYAACFQNRSERGVTSLPEDADD